MKKLVLTWLACVIAFSLQAQEPYPELGAKLDEYFTALAGEKVEVQSQECDFLISSCQDSLVRQYVALKIYNHYLASKIMGDEGVAVHIADKWFLSGKIPMHSDEDLLNAKVYAEFNRASLVGQPAPPVTLFAPDGSPVDLPSRDGYSVLYFYDTGCSTCKVETERLSGFIQGAEFPDAKVYAIYIGEDAALWEAYRGKLPGAIHLWDPEISSDWQRKYGVLQTPRMFLVSPSGTIVGRGLDTPALRMLLGREYATGNYVYGEEKQMEQYRQLFSTYGDSLTVSHVMDVADALAARTMGEGDTESFKQIAGDMLYYLSSQKSEVYRDACTPFVDKYINLPEVWTSEADKAQVVSLGKMLSELTGRTPVGGPLPNLDVQAVRRRKPCLFQRGFKEGVFNLSAFKGKPGYVVFYSQGCSSCKETLEAVERIVSSNRRARVLLVDMDALFSDYPDQAKDLLDNFDLSAMPMVVEVDKKGIVRHRYVDLTKIH